MDFADFEKAAEKGATLELKGPAGAPLTFTAQEGGKPVTKPITITLAGVESPRWTQASDALQNKLQDQKDTVRTVQEMRADRAGILAKMTLAWEGIQIDGKDLPCSEENAKKFYVRFKFVMEQVDKFLGQKENFLPTLSQS